MISRWVRCVACLGVGLSCSMAARQAAAWEATQVTLQATALSYQKITVTLDGANGGASASASSSLTSYGLFGSGVGAGVGYAWNNVLFGVRANYQSASAGAGSASTLSLFPRLEYQTNPGETGAFIAGLLGIIHDSSGDSTSGTAYGFGGAVGVHGFIDPAVSLDPELTVVGLTGSHSAGSQTLSESGVQVLLTFGLSGWIRGRHTPSQFPSPPPETGEPPQAAAAPAGEEEEDTKPLYTSVHLPGHRQLYLQVSKDPARTSLIVRLSESRAETALASCDDISVFAGTGPLKMRVRSHGDHFVAGRLPLRAAELLASSDATISVCTVQWTLGQESREAIQTFLNDRRDLLDKTGDSDAPGETEAAPPLPAPGAAPSDVAPVPPPPAAAIPPTGSFAPAPAPTPAPPPAAAPAPAAPKKK